jgi:hypothetical protein
MQLLPFLSCLLAVGTHALVGPNPNEQIVQKALEFMNIDPAASSLEASTPTTLQTVVSSAPTAQAADFEAAAADPGYWLKDIKKQGIAAFNDNPAGYKVFRNVKDYGAKGKYLQPKLSYAF